MRIEWTLFAVEDREAIFDYIEADSRRAAIAVDDRICAKAELLKCTREIGRIGRVPDTRELVVNRTPYVVVYEVGACARILRVLHGARQWPEDEMAHEA